MQSYKPRSVTGVSRLEMPAYDVALLTRSRPMGQAIRPNPEVDLHVLQAQVMAQGLLLKAIARTIDDPAQVRQFFAQELDRVLPTLSEETMGFVAVQANVMIHQFYGTAGPRTGPPPAPAAGRP